mgnify:CR=1 FL=1|tara:strand:+ start:2060 stop:2317 length:258 start_codon:yes stop_codon:yes gene_type:complete
MKKHAIETENLEAHVDLCAERYDSLLDKINRLDHRMGDMELITRNILEKLAQMERRSNSNWFTVAGATIGLLFTVVGYLIVNFVA